MAKEILTEDNIVLNADPKDKWDAIRMCGELLVKNGYVLPDYIEDMYKREKVATVYIGNHVAIPHGVDESRERILDSGISFLQTPQGVKFGDDEIAYMFIGIAGKNDTHVEMLSKIAIACSDMDNIDILRTTSDKKKIIDILLSEEN